MLYCPWQLPPISSSGARGSSAAVADIAAAQLPATDHGLRAAATRLSMQLHGTHRKLAAWQVPADKGDVVALSAVVTEVLHLQPPDGTPAAAKRKAAAMAAAPRRQCRGAFC